MSIADGSALRQLQSKFDEILNYFRRYFNQSCAKRMLKSDYFEPTFESFYVLFHVVILIENDFDSTDFKIYF